jgi:hypothetical protein
VGSTPTSGTNPSTSLTTLHLKTASLVTVLSLLSFLPAAAAEHELKFLPFFGPNLEAARYFPPDGEFAWVGWIGATVDLMEKGKWVAYFDPNVETILGHRIHSFEAVQANYSLEVGVRRDLGAGRITTFYHHVSRHIQDRDKFGLVDWNFLGVSTDGPLPAKWNRRGGYFASLAFATLSSGVDYNWEGRAALDLDVWAKDNKGVFMLADVRVVGANPSAGFERGSFADFRGEAGFRRFQGSSQLALFAAYEHRNDALVSSALVIDRVLIGFRLRNQRRPAPIILPLP